MNIFSFEYFFIRIFFHSKRMVKHIDVEVLPDQLIPTAKEIAASMRSEWKQCDKIQVRIFTDGITNRLVGFFHPSNPDDVVLVRVYGNHTELFIDRKIEIRNMKLMHESGLSPPIYATFNNGICYGFTPGSVSTYQMVTDSTISSLIAAKLARMHSLVLQKQFSSFSNTGKTATLFDSFKKYLNLLPRSLDDQIKDQR